MGNPVWNKGPCKNVDRACWCLEMRHSSCLSSGKAVVALLHLFYTCPGLVGLESFVGAHLALCCCSLAPPPPHPRAHTQEWLGRVPSATSSLRAQLALDPGSVPDAGGTRLRDHLKEPLQAARDGHRGGRRGLSWLISLKASPELGPAGILLGR